MLRLLHFLRRIFNNSMTHATPLGSLYSLHLQCMSGMQVLPDNAVFLWKIGRTASCEVILQLIKFKCFSVLY